MGQDARLLSINCGFTENVIQHVTLWALNFHTFNEENHLRGLEEKSLSGETADNSSTVCLSYCWNIH